MAQSPLKLYELVADDRTIGFSPYVWRVRMAIKHLGLDHRLEIVPLQFQEFEKELAFAGSKTVPVILDGDVPVADSWDIVCYLNDKYGTADNNLFANEAEKAHCRMIENLTFQNLLKAVFPALCNSIFDIIPQEAKAHYRTTREARMGITLEEAKSREEAARLRFLESMKAVDIQLGEFAYLGGDSPRYSDYILYSIYYWIEAVNDKDFTKGLPNVIRWLKEMKQL